MLRATEEVFAAGDMIAFRPGAIPRSGVYAVRAGPVLADNIRATLTGQPYAVLTRNGVTLEGSWAWRLKDRTDRRWVARYNDLPPSACSAIW